MVGLMAIELAEFGRTGHLSTRVIFGGASLAAVSQRVADESLDVLFTGPPDDAAMAELVERSAAEPLFV